MNERMNADDDSIDLPKRRSLKKIAGLATGGAAVVADALTGGATAQEKGPKLGNEIGNAMAPAVIEEVKEIIERSDRLVNKFLQTGVDLVFPYDYWDREFHRVTRDIDVFIRILTRSRDQANKQKVGSGSELQSYLDVLEIKRKVAFSAYKGLQERHRRR